MPTALFSMLCNVYAYLTPEVTVPVFLTNNGGVSGSHCTQRLSFAPTFPSCCPWHSHTHTPDLSHIADRNRCLTVSRRFRNGSWLYYQDVICIRQKTPQSTETRKMNVRNHGIHRDVPQKVTKERVLLSFPIPIH
ncbi:hypothetical protein H4582DRAFT_675370 [Lactarius indigo]|nr:hypothetical protein H4582DRAFT_675370 [Lactarius indigo]